MTAGGHPTDSGSDRDRPERREGFQRNPRLESLLESLSAPLAAAEDVALGQRRPVRRPILLIVGCARSGTTLLLQWLADSGAFSYPSNFMSRFSSAPVVGALVQQMLFDPAFRFRSEMQLDSTDGETFESELGKTVGALSPNEFHYFWRRWFDDSAGVFPNFIDADLAHFAPIERELLGIADVFRRPFVTKAPILSAELTRVADRLADAVILVMRRDRAFNAQSLLEARRCFTGSKETWYSYRPPNVVSTPDMTPEAEVVAQVVDTERLIDDQIRGIDPARVVEMRYEEFCRDPQTAWQRIVATVGLRPQGDLSHGQPRLEPFRSRNTPDRDTAELELIRSALARYT